MTTYTTILYIVTIAACVGAVYCACYGDFHANRAGNLETRNEQLCAHNAELAAALDDVTRERDRYRTSNDRLLQEGNTMALEILRQQETLDAMQRTRRYRREQQRGYLLACQMVRAGREMVVEGNVP